MVSDDAYYSGLAMFVTGVRQELIVMVVPRRKAGICMFSCSSVDEEGIQCDAT